MGEILKVPSNPEYTSVDRTLEAEISPQTEVIRRPITEPYGIYRRLMGKGSSTDMKTLTAGAAGGSVTPISSGRKSFKQRLSLWIRGNFFVPDPRIWWIRPSVRFLKKYLKEHPVDVIVTTGPPHSMHLIGEKLSKATGLPWIPDFRDPWTKMYYLKYLPLTSPVRKRLLKMEQSVLLVQDDFRSRTSTPVAMITNGYDEDDFVGPVESDGLFNIVHTGLFAEDGNPLTLWKVLGKKVAENPEFKEKMRLRLVGKVDGAVMEAIEAEGLKENVVDLGYKAHEAAVREQRAASLLILPLRNDPDYKPILPGKLFEYLAARRPILGIGQEDGAMARLLDEIALPGRIVSNWDNEERTRSFIDSVWSDYLEKGDTLLPPDGIDRFSRRSLTKELSHLLESQVSSK